MFPCAIVLFGGRALLPFAPASLPTCKSSRSGVLWLDEREHPTYKCVLLPLKEHVSHPKSVLPLMAKHAKHTALLRTRKLNGAGLH